MNGTFRFRSNSKHRPKRVSSRAQMRDISQKLERSPFLLQWISGGISFAVDFRAIRHKLNRLARGRRLHEFSIEPNARPRRDAFKIGFADRPFVDHHLQITKARPVAQLNKADALAIAPSFYPTVRGNLGSR